MAGGDTKQGAEPSAPIEAEDEFIKVGLEVFAAQAVIDAQRPGLEVGKDAVAPAHRPGAVRALRLRARSGQLLSGSLIDDAMP